MIRLSQAHLQSFAQCPPSFQRRYLAQLAEPIDPNQIQKQQWGVQFHLMMQQLRLGLPLDTLVTDEELENSVAALLEKIPDFLHTEAGHFSEAEHRRMVQQDNFALTVIYDWVVQRGDRLTICDWKTFPQPENPNYLRNHWQTKLYLYILAETTEFAPEQLSMTYWFVKLPKEPESFTVEYSAELHAKTTQELSLLLTRLQHSMDDYFRANIPLQHPDQQVCKRCPTQLMKGRSPAILAGKTVDAFLNEITPIEL